MANLRLFESFVGRMLRRPDAVNAEGAPAYALEPKAALAQYAMTGCLNTTFYATDDRQLDAVLALCNVVEPEFIAKAAVYARDVGFMKDMPAVLCAALAVRDGTALERVFPRVIDTPRMLRSFVQIVRSGVTGRRSLGTRPRRLVRAWLDARSDDAIFTASIGTRPSLADIVRMVHPKPRTPSRDALYAYLLGRPVDVTRLPELVRAYEAFKEDPTRDVPDVPFQMLTSLPLDDAQWANIAHRAPWHMTRMNLNTFARHGVFQREGMAQRIADRLRDRDAIGKARVMPYQLMTAFTQSGRKGVPEEVRTALQDAMEIAIDNVPAIEGEVVVCPDVSGSMQAPLTGHRRGASTVVRCVDVAALMAAAVLRKNPRARVVPFEHRVVPVPINARDSVMTNASRLAAVGGGGTNCSAPLAVLNRERAQVDLVIFVSDNQSWVDARQGAGTELMRQWTKVKERNPAARLVCIDVQPYPNSQAYDRPDVLNVGGFSDGVFDVVARFAAGGGAVDRWVHDVEGVEV